MALQFKQGIFFHIPKTGGVFVRRAIHGLTAFCGCKEIGDSPHNDPLSVDVDLSQFLTFCVVRNPLSWYKSTYRYEVQYEEKIEKLPDWAMKYQEFARGGKSFQQFIELTLAEYPNGAATEMFTRFYPHVDIVLKTETLTETLGEVIRQGGVKYTYSQVTLFPKFNLSDPSIDTSIDTSLLRTLYEIEKPLFDRFDYPAPSQLT